MRLFLILLGLAMMASGLLWAAQGSSLLPYPESSPMVGSRPWIGWGILMALAGLLVIWLGWRSARR